MAIRTMFVIMMAFGYTHCVAIGPNAGEPKVAKVHSWFELTKDEVLTVNGLMPSLIKGDNLASVSEQIKGIRQPFGMGGKEERRYDKKNNSKLGSHCLRLYIRRINMDTVNLNDVVVNFWFRDGKLYRISANTDQIHIPENLR